MSQEIEKKITKILVELINVKEDIKVSEGRIKDEINEKVNEVLTAVDGLAKKVENVETEQASNLAAHDRFEGRISKLEGHVIA